MYKMEVNNVARHIMNNPAGQDGALDAFTASRVLEIAHCKDKMEVIQDILKAQKNERERAKSDPDYGHENVY